MKIKLLADYRGVLTNEEFFAAGEHDLPEGVAAALVSANRAEYVESKAKMTPAAKPAAEAPAKPAAKKKAA